jgi:hypothetical protein
LQTAALKTVAVIGTVFRNYDVAASLAPEYAFDSGVGHHFKVIPFDTIRTARCVHSEISKKP